MTSTQKPEPNLHRVGDDEYILVPANVRSAAIALSKKLKEFKDILMSLRGLNVAGEIKGIDDLLSILVIPGGGQKASASDDFAVLKEKYRHAGLKLCDSLGKFALILRMIDSARALSTQLAEFREMVRDLDRSGKIATAADLMPTLVVSDTPFANCISGKD